MARNTKQTIPFVRQHLLDAIEQIKAGASRDDILPKLEIVMQQLQALATHDHLTGALNRQTLLERLGAELQRSARTGQMLTVAAIGVDHLQDLMEVHGQEATKRILQVVTMEATSMLRGLDSFGRIDVTEFGIVMPSTCIEQAQVALARLKLRFAQYDWDEVAPGLGVDFCTGITQSVSGVSAEAVLQRALDALQQARLLGVAAVVQLAPDLPSE